MWVSDRHPDRDRLLSRPRPPEPKGTLLASIPRRSGAVEQELRIALDEYEGHPYVAIRLWERNPEGDLWPVKGKGISVRIGELDEVLDAIQAAIGAAGELDRQREPIRQGRGSGGKVIGSNGPITPGRTATSPSKPRRGRQEPREDEAGGWSRDPRPEPPGAQGPPDPDGDAY